ncbi:MAG: hypothetical protein V3S32_07460 [Acidimicrobiia bacterium]
MRRLLIFALLAGGMLVALRTLSERAGPAIREQCSGMCDRMLASMPESFPPNRMMADLEALKEKTDRILEALEENKAVDGPQE